MNQKEKYNKQYFKRFSFKIGNSFDGFQIFEIFNKEKEFEVVYDHYFTSRSNKNEIIKTKLSEKDLLRLYCLEHRGTSFTEVSVGNKTIAKNSTDRRIDIVRIGNDIYKWHRQYGKNKEYFQGIVKHGYEIELVENKTKLNRAVIGQILVGEYLFKKKFNVENVSLAVLYHIGDELLEMFCKDKGIKLIHY